MRYDFRTTQKPRHVPNDFQTQKRSDLKLFLQSFRPEAAGAADTFPIVKIANAQDEQGTLDADQLDAQLNVEGNLDGELAIGNRIHVVVDWWIATLSG
jgi:hypothetical protein